MNQPGERATTAVSTAALALGLALILVGIIDSRLAHTVGGAFLSIAALAFLALRLIHAWITDTDGERRHILAATQRAEDERVRYLAAQSALSLERDRMRRDAEYATVQAAAELEAERKRLRAQFEEERGTLICQSFEAAFHILTAGRLFDSTEEDSGREVIPFPGRSDLAEGSTERDRGVSRP